MSIRLRGGRSISGKAHQTTTQLKLLFVILVFLSSVGILVSPNLKLVLSPAASQQEDAVVFSEPRIRKQEGEKVSANQTRDDHKKNTTATATATTTMSGSNGAVIVETNHGDLQETLLEDNKSNTNKNTTNHVTGPSNGNSIDIETLALLYPPGLIGGYRNQVMRFTAFVRHAMDKKIPQMLLPSIYFSTTYEEDSTERLFYPIRMADVFDVEYWNDYSSTNEMPALVESMDKNGDCWTTTHNNHIPSASQNITQHLENETFASTIQKYSGALDRAPSDHKTPQMVLDLAKRNHFLVPLRNVSLAIASGHAILKRPRKVGVTPDMLQCQHPKVYGGGNGGAGILWNDFLNKIRNEVNSSVVHSVSQALRPALQWREVAHQCIHQDSNNTKETDDSSSHRHGAPYFALHTRVELEMMRHKCGKYMEMNLTKIFHMVDDMIGNYNRNHTDQQVSRAFLAVSRQGMEEARGKNKTEHERLANENLDTLTRRLAEGRNPASEKSTIFECGEGWMKQWYSQQDQVADNYYGTLIPMVLNFYIATEATVFIGTEKSSWSTDVWTTRYYQGKGGRNYRYTKDGIIPVPNNGLPVPHGNCR